MVLLAVLRHQWRAISQASGPGLVAFSDGWRLGSLLLVVLAAATGGAFAEEWIQLIAPEAHPVLWLNALWLPIGVLYVVGRGYEEAGPPGLQSYLSLPISRSALVRFGVAHALMHPVNICLLAFGMGFWGGAVVWSQTWVGSMVYGAGLLLGLGTASHLAFLCHRALGRRPLRVVSIVVGGGILTWIGQQHGWFSLFSFSEWLFGGLLGLQMEQGFLLLGSYGATLTLHRRRLYYRLYLDDGYRHKGSSEYSKDTSVESAPVAGKISRGIDHLLPIDGWGTVGALVAMKWRLISRNWQSRRLALILVFPFLISLVAWVGATTSAPLTYEGLPLVWWGTAVGGWVWGYGMLLFAWEGRLMEGILARSVRPWDLLGAEAVMLTGGTLCLWLLPLPAVLLAGSRAVFLHGCFLAYSLGWGMPVVLAAAPFHRTPVDLNNRRLVSTSDPALEAFLTILLIGPAVGIFFWADGLSVFTTGLMVIGGLSALLMPIWGCLFRCVWTQRRHSMLEEFSVSQ